MRRLLIILSLSFLLGSCIGTKRYSRFVYQKLDSSLTTRKSLSNDFLIVKTDSLVKPDTLVTTKKLKSFFIPAIVYWQWENTMRCDFDPEIPATILFNAVASYSDVIRLKDKLNGQQLEISINKIPSGFIYTDKGNCVFLFFAYMMSHLEAIYPEHQNLLVNFRVLKDGHETKAGVVIIKNEDIPVKNIAKSTKKFTGNYFEQYKNNIKRLSKSMIDQIVPQM